MNGPRDFSARAETYQFDGFLFDMDGTIIDSTPAIVNHWHKYIILRETYDVAVY